MNDPQAARHSQTGTYTAKYTYDALNQRVRMDPATGDAEEFVYNAFGRHSSSWDAVNGGEWSGWVYWSGTPIVFYGNGQANLRASGLAGNRAGPDHLQWPD